MATSRREDDITDSPSQFTPPRIVSLIDDAPISDDDCYHGPYTPLLLTFTPTSTPQKSDYEESPSEPEFESKGDSFCRKLTFSCPDDTDEGLSTKDTTR